jgi:hypothetical protein
MKIRENVSFWKGVLKNERAGFWQKDDGTNYFTRSYEDERVERDKRDFPLLFAPCSLCEPLIFLAKPQREQRRKEVKGTLNYPRLSVKTQRLSVG